MDTPFIQKYHKGKLEICWVHLKRNFEGIKKIGEKIECAEVIAFAEKMENLRKRLIESAYEFEVREEISRIYKKYITLYS